MLNKIKNFFYNGKKLFFSINHIVKMIFKTTNKILIIPVKILILISSLSLFCLAIVVVLFSALSELGEIKMNRVQYA